MKRPNSKQKTSPTKKRNEKKMLSTEKRIEKRNPRNTMNLPFIPNKFFGEDKKKKANFSWIVWIRTLLIFGVAIMGMFAIKNIEKKWQEAIRMPRVRKFTYLVVGMTGKNKALETRNFKNIFTYFLILVCISC